MTRSARRETRKSMRVLEAAAVVTCPTRRGPALLLLLGTVLAASLLPSPAGAVTREEMTRRECAICHVGWFDVVQTKKTPLAPHEWKPSPIQDTLRFVADDEMCYSCHDGYVKDSRQRVWEGKGHSVGKKPSADIVLPTNMPLDSKGTVYCGTCHTPHGVGEQTAELTNSIFLRVEDTDSRMCTECHVRELKGLGRQNHPVNINADKPLSQEVYWLGGRLGSDPRRIICQSCHTPHGKGTLLKPADDSTLCLMCHEDRNGKMPFLQNGRPLHPVGVTPARDLSGSEVNRNGARWGPGNRLICLTCHGVHQGVGQAMTRAADLSRFCQDCHGDVDGIVAVGKHNFAESGSRIRLADGESPQEIGSCRVCHRAHGWARHPEDSPESSSRVCLDCHGPGGAIPQSGVGAISHPVGVDLKEFRVRDGFDLSPLRWNGTQKVVCSTCHEPHQIPAAGDVGAQTSGDARGQIAADVGAHVQTPAGAGSGVETATGAASRAKTPAASGLLEPVTASLRSREPDFCKACHLDHFTVEGTKHELAGPEALAKFEHYLGPVEEHHACIPCHRVHDAKAGGLWYGELPAPKGTFDADEGSRKCLSCHALEAFRKIVQKNGHPIGRPMKAEYAPAAEEVLKLGRIALDQAGQRDVVVCSTCHLNHGKRNADGSITLYAGGGVANGDLCVACHPDKTGIIGSPHDFRTMPAGKFHPDDGRSLRSGVCAGCHVNHDARIEQGLIPFAVNPPRESGNPEDMFCLHCHLDARVTDPQRLKFYIHPTAERVREVLAQRSSKSTARGNARVGESDQASQQGPGSVFHVKCITCHDNHRWTRLPPEAARSLTQTALTSFLKGPEVAQTVCANCHGLQGLFLYNCYHQDRAFQIRIPNR